MNIHAPICLCDRVECQQTSAREHLLECACIAGCMCVCENGCVRWISRMHVCVCVCVWLGFKIVSRACVINVPKREGPKDISQAEGEQRKCIGEGRGAERKDRLVSKKKRRLLSWGGTGFSWVLLCFPLCKPWSPAACQQAK